MLSSSRDNNGNTTPGKTNTVRGLTWLIKIFF